VTSDEFNSVLHLMKYKTPLMVWGLVLTVMVGRVGAGELASAGSEATGQAELPYTAVQAAFLREDFAYVVRLAQPWLEPVSLEPQAIRIRLWYCLSLERLQRANDALRELDRLKAALMTAATRVASSESLAAARDSAQDGGRRAEQERLWPEVLFWEGEISRRAFQFIRARLAYHRLLTSYPQSMWHPQAQLGLGLVLFQQQAYDVARQQMQEVQRAADRAGTILAGEEMPRAVERAALPPWVAREAQVVEGLCDLQLKEYGAAAAHFRQLLGEAPDPATRAKVAFYLGEALTGLKETTQSLQAYQDAIEADPQSTWARLARFGSGWSLFQQHRCAESLKALDDYMKASGAEADRQQPELLFAQGRCLLELGDDRAAIARLETLRRTSPTHPLALEAAISLAEALERQHRSSEAVALLAPLLRQPLSAPQRQQAGLRLGSVYLAQGEGAKALEQFQRLQPSDESEARQASLNGQGDAHMVMGQAEEASRCYQEAWAMGPEDQGGSYALYQLGRLKLQAGKTGEAMESFRQVIGRGTPARADPLAADARLALAAALLSDAQPEQARQELERLRTLAPESTQAARAGYYLALLALREAHDPDARRFCQDVIQRAPYSEEAIQARLLLADLAVEQGTPEQVLTTLPKLFDELQLPNDESVSSGVRDDYRGRLAKKFGDLAQQARACAHTIHWYELAWDAWPALRGELDYRIASCYEQVGDQPLAVHRYRAISHAPWQVRGQLAAAKLMERDQQWQEAMAIYKTITQQPVPEAKIAKERLALLERSQLVHSQ